MSEKKNRLYYLIEIRKRVLSAFLALKDKYKGKNKDKNCDVGVIYGQLNRYLHEIRYAALRDSQIVLPEDTFKLPKDPSHLTDFSRSLTRNIKALKIVEKRLSDVSKQESWDVPSLPERIKLIMMNLPQDGTVIKTYDLIGKMNPGKPSEKHSIDYEPGRIYAEFIKHEIWGPHLKQWINRPKQGYWQLNTPKNIPSNPR